MKLYITQRHVGRNDGEKAYVNYEGNLSQYFNEQIENIEANNIYKVINTFLGDRTFSIILLNKLNHGVVECEAQIVND